MVAIQSTTRGSDVPESVHRTGLSVLLIKRLTVAAPFPQHHSSVKVEEHSLTATSLISPIPRRMGSII